MIHEWALSKLGSGLILTQILRVWRDKDGSVTTLGVSAHAPTFHSSRIHSPLYGGLVNIADRKVKEKTDVQVYKDFKVEYLGFVTKLD